MDHISSGSFGQELPSELHGNFEKLPLIELARLIERTNDQEEKRQCISLFLDSFSEAFHAKFSSDVTPFYRAMEQEGLLVRLEMLSAVMEDLLERKPIHLGEAGDGKYANAVLPKNEGIKIAFSEGLAPGPVRLILGFDVHSMIGFDAHGLEVSDIDISPADPRDASVRKALCRHVEGDLLPGQIKYLILRLPFNLVDEQHLTEKELEETPDFVFRGTHLVEETRTN